MDDLQQLERDAQKLKSDGDFTGAIDKYHQMLQVDEKFVRAHLALAVLYHQTADYAKSVEHAEKAVEIEPNDPFNLAALSITYQRAFMGTQDPAYIEKAETARDRSHHLG